MQQCQIYNSALRFSRATYGFLTLIAFFLKNEWLVLAVGLLMILAVFSIKLNLPYQLHVFITNTLLKKKVEPITKELGEINFVSAMTGALLLIGFGLVYYGQYDNLGWVFILIITALIFLACFVGFCVATLMYVFFRKLIKK